MVKAYFAVTPFHAEPEYRVCIPDSVTAKLMPAFLSCESAHQPGLAEIYIRNAAIAPHSYSGERRHQDMNFGVIFFPFGAGFSALGGPSTKSTRKPVL